MGNAAVTGVSGRHQPGWEDAYRRSPVEGRASEALLLLLEMEQRFLERLERLQSLERRLAAGAHRNRDDSGRRTIRQIERERQRLGRELHTEVGQMLAAISIQLEIIDTEFPSAPEPVRESLQKISVLARQALDRVRNISRRIHPPEWQRLRLEDALRQVWDLAGVEQRFESHVSIQTLESEPPVEIKSLIFRAAQEGLANVLRHSGAKRVGLTFSFQNHVLSLQMRDDGVGFDANQLFAAPASVAAGIGLRSIREQAGEVKGKLSIISGPLGTTLEISVPWTPRAP